MRKTYLNICFFIPFVFTISTGPIDSRVYDWKQPVKTSDKKISTTVLFEGSAFDMEWLQMNANALNASKEKIKMTTPQDEEHLYIVKKGALEILTGDSSNTLVPGSVAAIMPGKTFFFQNKQNSSCEYYLMKYRSKLPIDTERGNKAGGSIIKSWDRVAFKPHDKGGIRNYFERPTAMMKRLEIHVTTLNAGLKSHEPHTHRAEEIVLMIEGNTEMQIGESFCKGKEGSIFFLGSNISHAIRNEGTKPCTYFAIQFE
jgi:(S)-ureidoglycine aminohydrolase